jgi:hypothetical protein
MSRKGNVLGSRLRARREVKAEQFLKFKTK